MSMLNTIKLSAFALLSGVLIAAPAMAQSAAGTTQVSKQQFGQVGVGNVGIVDNDQTAIVDQGGFFPGVAGASTLQVSGQKGAQQGVGNFMELDSTQASDTTQLPGFFAPGIDGANTKQMSDQSAGQSGISNDLTVVSTQDTFVFQP
jgi:hypothetical protein